MRTLDARHLNLFEAIFANRSITRAAQRLGLSQPTVSIGLGQLRRHFGDPLFVQTPQGMTPTPFAADLIGPVRETLEDLKRISDARAEFDPMHARREFRIAMTDASHITLMPHIYAALRNLAPLCTIRALPIRPDTGAALISGDADVAIGLVPELEDGFYQRVLYDQDWICLTRKVAGRPPLTRAAYEAAEHVHVSYGTGQLLLEAAVRDQVIARHVALHLPGFLGLPAILNNSDLVATLPRHIGESLATLGGLAAHQCPIAIAGFQVKIHWHARYHRDPANVWLRRICIDRLSADRAG